MKSIHLLQLAVFAAGLGLVAPAAHAEDKTDCALTYNRTACAGQEAESYKKCDGKQSCTKNVAAADEAACQTAAVEACANDRPTVTKSKVITATYKGKAVKSKGGKPDLCQDYAKRAAEFNQCEKK
jgi:hypothetical protein